MAKKEAILIALLAALSIFVLASIFFDFGIENILEFQKQRQEQEQQENKSVEEQDQNQTEIEMNKTEEQEQKETLDPSLWCKKGAAVKVVSDIFGEGKGTKIIIGVEKITLGFNLTNATFVCEACHTTITYAKTDRAEDWWTNVDKILLTGGDVDKEECSKFTSSKTFLRLNETTYELEFSDEDILRERWYDEEGRTCLVTNKILRSLGGAQCY